jgi:hypothetical protein
MEGLVALLRLQAVDAQPQVSDVPVGPAQQVGILLAGGDHGPVAAEVDGDGVLGKADPVTIDQFVPDLGDGPVPGEAAVADETEDVPADQPTGQGEGKFGGRAEGGRARRAGGIGAMSEATAKLHGMLQGIDAMTAATADVQGRSAADAVGLPHVKGHSLKDGALWPTETHLPLQPARSGQSLVYTSSV